MGDPVNGPHVLHLSRFVRAHPCPVVVQDVIHSEWAVEIPLKEKFLRPIRTRLLRGLLVCSLSAITTAKKARIVRSERREERERGMAVVW